MMMILAMVQEYLMPLTPSADIPLPVSSIPKPADIDLVGKYVVVPYGPQFHIAKVQEQYHSTMYIECMVPVSRLEYIWKRVGDTGYEEPFEEDIDKMLCINQPPKAGLRRNWIFLEAHIEKIEHVFRL